MGKTHRAITLVATFLAAMLAARSGAAQGWTDVRVAGPFVCRADFPLQGLERLLGELAGLQNDLAVNLGLRGPAEPIELYLFRDEQSYRRYLAHYLPDMPYRRALYYKGNGPGKVLVHRSADFEVDIRHECTHALLHSTLPMVPLWLDEGLAEYFELPPGQRAHGNPYLRSIKWNVRFGLVPRLDKLEREGDFSKLDRNDYRDSWAWVHFMLLGPPEAKAELTQFLADIQASSPPGTLSERLAARIPDLADQFSGHFKGWRQDDSTGVKAMLGKLGGLVK